MPSESHIADTELFTDDIFKKQHPIAGKMVFSANQTQKKLTADALKTSDTIEYRVIPGSRNHGF